MNQREREREPEAREGCWRDGDVQSPLGQLQVSRNQETVTCNDVKTWEVVFYMEGTVRAEALSWEQTWHVRETAELP